MLCTQAEVIVRGSLTVYMSSRSYKVHRRETDIIGVQDLIQPVVEGGFASEASISATSSSMRRCLMLAFGGRRSQGLRRSVMLRAKLWRLPAGPRRVRAIGEAGGGASPPPLPAWLGQFLQIAPADEAVLRQISPVTLAALAAAIEQVDSGRRHSNVVQGELYDDLRAKFAECSDYKGRGSAGRR